MKHVLLRSYSRFFVYEPRMNFLPVLDLHSGTWIAHAEIDTAEALAHCEANPAYEILTDEEYQAVVTKPAASEPASGDPLTDASATGEKPSADQKADPLDGPPAPPAAKK